MNEKEIKKLLMDIPMVLCRNMNNRFVSTIIRDLSYDLSHHHFMILRILSEKRSMFTTEIVEYLGITKPQMTASIDRLSELNFVTRKHDERDRRKIHIEITKKGKELTMDVLKRIDRNLTESFRSLSADEIQSLGSGVKILFKMCKFYEGNENE